MLKKLLLIIFVGLFLLTRFYRTGQTFYFYNDMGRDLLVLLEWQKFGKLPLVGPQTSALPINQSPIYYYLLAPFYFILGRSPYSALVLNTVVYLLSFFIAFYLTRSHSVLNRSVYLTFLLVIFHPQHILQNRFVWNPSLLPPLLVLSLVLFLLSFEKSRFNFMLSAIFLLSLSISLHYSAIPILLAYLIIILFFQKKFFIKSLVFSLVCLFILNITTVVQLTKRLFVAGVLFYPNQVFQTGSTISQKIHDFIYYCLGLSPGFVSYLFLTIVFCLSLGVAIFSKKLSKLAALIFLITSVVTLLTPFNLQAHYIFAITSTLFVFISILNWRVSLPIILFLLFFYLRSSQINTYFQPVPRSYQQMDSCFEKFCSQFKSPIFVSVISNLYPYHYGPEFRYLMLKNGCQMRHIEKGTNAANYMAVVLDDGSYSSKSRYYELDLFGSHQQIKSITCQSNLGIVLLKKKKLN